MKMLIKILKTVLLWVTTLSVIIFLDGGIEQLLIHSMWTEAILWVASIVLLLLLCRKYLPNRYTSESDGGQYIMFQLPPSWYSEQPCSSMPLQLTEQMKTMYLDIMVDDRFYRQIPYEYSPIFAIDYGELVDYVIKKLPSLANEKKSWTIREGKKVFR